MLKRDIADILLEKSKYYPILGITGPRQSGKTTLSRYLFADKPYVSLEDPDQLQFAHEEPRGFLQQFPNGAILDEVQRCPSVFSYLQTLVDQYPQKMGVFILTGSQQFGLMENITQSLAGRIGLVQLLPFKYDELQKGNCDPKNLEALIFNGSYPPIYDRKASPTIWYADYVMTYLERDVRQLINIQDLRIFQKFIRMCAARTGQIVNLSSLANDCGITHNTAKAWLSVLEASYLIHLLPPHHSNFNKRLIKSPKLYFYDTGLACYLVGITNPEQIIIHAMRGALFETWVANELIKSRFNQGLPSNLFFWRDSQGHEIDFLIDHGDHFSAIEVKAGQTINTDYFTNLKFWSDLSGSPINNNYLIYAGISNQERSSAHIVAWKFIDTIK